MIHEVILVLAGFKSSIISVDNTLVSDDSSVLHPSEQPLLAQIARFGELHREIIKAIQDFEYDTTRYTNSQGNTTQSNLNDSESNSNNVSASDNEDSELPAIPKSYILTRSAVVSVIEARALKKLAQELEDLEASILENNSKYVGGNNTVSVSQIVGTIISEWHRVLQYSKYILDMFGVLPASEINTDENNEPMMEVRDTQGNATRSSAPWYHETEIISTLYTLTQDAKAETYQTKQNVFLLFTELIGYPEVDMLRRHCLLAIHRSWLQLVSSWLLYGHVVVASSAFESSFDEAEQHKLVEYLLVNKSQDYSSSNYGATLDNTQKYSQLDQSISDNLFLPPGVTSQMGYLIYTTGNMVRIFVGISSYGTSKSSNHLGAESTTLFQNIHSSSIPHSAFSRPSTSSSTVTGPSIDTPTISYIPTHTIVEKYVPQITSLALPVDPYPLLDVVTQLRSSVLKAIGTAEFSKARVWSYFYTIRRIVLAGDVGFSTLFTDQLLRTKEEADKNAGVKSNKKEPSNFSNVNLAYYENLYDTDEQNSDDGDIDLGLESDTNMSSQQNNRFLGSSNVTPDMILKRLAPETLRRALMTAAESLDECNDEMLSKMIDSVQKDVLQSRHKNNGAAFTNKCFQAKQMYLEATEFLELSVLDQEDTNSERSNSLVDSLPNSRIHSGQSTSGNISQRSGTDIFKTTFLGIPTQLNFQLNWFQATLTKLPELDCAKYSILFSFLMSLFLSHQILTEQWKQIMFKRGPYFRGTRKDRNASEEEGNINITQPFEDLLQAVQHTRVFLTEVWDYLQVTVIDQSFSKLLKKCFPQKEKNTNSRFTSLNASTDSHSFNSNSGQSIFSPSSRSAGSNPSSQVNSPEDTDVDMTQEQANVETVHTTETTEDDTFYVEPDTIAQFHQDFVSEVYDTIFLDSDTVSTEFLNLMISIKSVCLWLSRNHASIMAHSIDTRKKQQEIVMEMKKFENNLYQRLDRIVEKVELVQQNDDEAAVKYPLHLLLLRVEFVRERSSRIGQNDYEDTEMGI